MKKIMAWNNQGYFEYLDEEELFDYSTRTYTDNSKQKNKQKKDIIKPTHYCWIKEIERAEKQTKENEAKTIRRSKSNKYDKYFDVDDSYRFNISGSYNLLAYGKNNEYLNKGDFNYREYGSRFGSGVLCDDYDN